MVYIICFLPGECGDIKAYRRPFFHCMLSNLVQNKDFTANLQDEILDLNFVEKNNDLYKFHQVILWYYYPSSISTCIVENLIFDIQTLYSTEFKYSR